MDWVTFNDFIQEVASTVTAFGIIVGAAWKLSENYRYRQDRLKQKRQEETLEAFKEAFKPQTEKLQRTKERVDVIEEKTYDHEGRLYILESEHGINNVRYVEHYHNEED